MNQTITQKVDAVRNTARRIVWIWATGFVLAGVIFSVTLFGFLDFLMRHQDSGMRYLIFAGIVALVSGLVYRASRSVSESRLSRLQTAKLIESHSPELSDKLSSSLAFLKQLRSGNTALTGQSNSMQQSVVAEVTDKLQDFDPQKILDYRSLTRILLLSGIALAIIPTIWLINPSAISTSLRRVLAPWSQAEWPRRNDLYFTNQVEQIAVGSDFVATVRDYNDNLPNAVTLEFLFNDSESDAVQTRQMNVLNDSMVTRLENVTRDFRYRAVGGDHSTRWHDMRVLPAPRLVDVEFTVTPPDYTGLPPHKFHDDVRAVAGSNLRVTATSEEPIIDADLHWTIGDRSLVQNAAVKNNRTIEYPVDDPADDRDAVLSESAVLRIVVRDSNHVIGKSERGHDIKVTKDQLPSIDLAAVTSISVTPRGTVGLRVSVNEDVRLKSTSLFYQVRRVEARSEESSVRNLRTEIEERLQGNATDIPTGKAIELYPNSNLDFADAEIVPIGDFGFGERFRSEIRFSVPSAGRLSPGDSISLIAVATDMKQQRQFSNELTIRISSDGELLQSLLEKQNRVYERLARALKRQRSATDQFSAIRKTLETPGEFDAATVSERMQPTRSSQREVIAILNEGDDSARAILIEIIRLGENNSVENKQFMTHIATILAEVDSITSGPLELIEFRLAELQRLITDDGKQLDQSQRSSSAEPISESQQEVVERLEQLVGELSHVDTLRNVINDWIEIRRKQVALQVQSKRLQVDTAGRKRDRLSKRMREELEKLTTGQNELVRQSRQATLDLQRLSEKMSSSAPRYAVTLRAAELCRELQIDETIREAVSQLSTNRIGNAIAKQSDAITAIEKLIELLQGDRQDDPQSRARATEEGKQELDALIGLQESVTKDLEDSNNRQEQSDLMQEAGETQQSVIERLNELQKQLADSEKADSLKKNSDDGQNIEKAAEDAITEARKTAEEIASENRKSAREGSELTEQRLKELREKFQQELQRQKSEEENARDENVIATLESLIDSQKELILRFVELAEQRHGEDLSKSAELRAIARSENDLAEAALSLSTQFGEQPAIAFALNQASEQLEQSATQLEQNPIETDKAVDRMNDALQTLELVRSAFARRKQQEQGEQPPPNDEPSPQEPGEGQPQLSAIELTLLIETQKSILQRTTEIEERRTANPDGLSPQQEIELERLRARESRLLEIVKLYIERMRQTDAGDKLPKPNVPLPGLPGLD